MKKFHLLAAFVLVIGTGPVLQAQATGNSAPGSAPATTSDDGSGGTDGTSTGGNGQRGKLKAALQQLGLSDAQKQQIRQIRATTQPGKERRQQIMAVLTPDQKQKLISMLQQYRAQHAAQ